MYPIAPAIRRTAAKPFNFGGYAIPAGENLIIATTVPHYLPRRFPDPHRFDIERYTLERGEHRRPGVFAPYGVGPHVCLGAGFAETVIALTIAAVLHGTELALDPPGYELKTRQAPTPSPDRSFRFRVTQRRSRP